MTRLRSVGDREYLPLADWDMAILEPGAAESPSGLAAGTPWSAARAPGTAASALRATGAWSFDVRRDFDASDVGYRRRFSFAPRDDARVFLCLGGLATL